MTQLSHSGLKCSPGASDDKKRVKKTFLKGNCCSQKTLHSHLRSPSNHGCCEVTHTIYEQIVIQANGRAVFLFVSLKVTFRSDVCKITYSCKAPGDRKSAFMCPERKAINKSVLFNKKGHKCSWWTSPTFCCWIHIILLFLYLLIIRTKHEIFFLLQNLKSCQCSFSNNRHSHFTSWIGFHRLTCNTEATPAESVGTLQPRYVVF